jgi:4-amino-4-deoxy-L-arabinose transferase-like glycosyltransferase
MRFTSLIVELIRARPRLIIWTAILAQAMLWLVMALLLYRAPPGEVPVLLAFGREYQIGTDSGPPLAFWLGDIAFRLAGGHMTGVYLLSMLCFAVMMGALFELGGAIVGRQQAALALLLTATISAFGYPGLEFSPAVLARPLWALVLLHAWRAVGQGRGNAWFALSIEAGLLLLTTHAALLLLGLLFGFMAATARGRRALLRSPDPWFALAVMIVLVAPYLAWLLRSGAVEIPALPGSADLAPRGIRFGEWLVALVLAMAGLILLTVLNTARLTPRPEAAPVIFRPPVDDFGRRFVLFFAIVPPLAGALISAVFGLDQLFGGTGTLLALAGLAVVVLAGDLIPLRRQEVLRTIWTLAVLAPAIALLASVFIGPWATGGEVATTLPARAMGQFFAESYERRTGQRLQAVAGDAQLAALLAYAAPRRPHLYLDASPQRTPWLTDAQFRKSGGLVVWRAADTAGTPPPELSRRFPDLAPEVPRAFERLVNGRQPLLRIGWGIVRPQP